MPKITGVDITNITKRSGVTSLSKASGIALSLGGGGGVPSTLLAQWDASDTNSYPGTGTTVYDLVGSADLTLTNGASWTNSGGIDRFVLDGVNDDIGMTGTPTALQLQFNTPFTIGMWMYPHFSNSAGFMTFVGNPYNTGGFEGVSIINGSTNSRLTPRLWMRSSSSSYILMTAGGALTQNAWQYLTVTYNGVKGVSGTKFYINGSEVTSTTGTNVGSSSNIIHNDFQIGSRQGVNSFYDGEVGDVHYHNVVQSASEILSYYNSTKALYGL